ncbi:hypothetical protein [Blastococcus sp. SYSU D00820]
MSRPAPSSVPAAVAARTALPESETAGFDRLTAAVLATPGAPLGGTLRAVLPGPAGVRWLRTAGLPPTARAAALTPELWLSLYECWSATARVPAGAGPARQRSARPSGAHGHGPGARPRWG